MNNKGSLLDGIFIIVVLIAFLLSTLIGITLMSSIFNDPQLREQAALSAAGNETINAAGRISDGGGFDNWFVMFYFGIHIVMLVLAGAIPIDSIWFALNIIFMFILLAIAFMFQTFGTQVITAFNVAGTTKMLWILRHAFTLEIAFAVFTLIVMFVAARNR